MATLYISEYANLGKDQRGQWVPVALEPAITDQAVTISAVSAQSAALNALTTVVRLQTDTACWVLFGTNPTATTSKKPLNAGQTEYFCVPANSNFKIAAITL